MTTPRNVAVIIGSLRRESLNRKVAEAVIKLAPDALKCEVIEIGQLPLYNQDHESEPPPAVRDFKAHVARMDSVLFFTPEYNRSVPGVLKNALDIGSRPYGKSSWNGKHAAIVSVSPGALGGFGANHHLRQSLVFLNMPTMGQPEAYIGNAAELFEPNGSFKTATRELMQKFIDGFNAFSQRNAQI